MRITTKLKLPVFFFLWDA